MTLKIAHLFKMKSTKFITELRARGLQITEKEAKYLMDIAVADYRENQVKPILKREYMAHYMIMALSYCKATSELLHMIDESYPRFRLKQVFMECKKKNNEVVEEFEKANKIDPQILNAFSAYANDITEIMYLHMDNIDEEKKEQLSKKHENH